MLLGEVVEFDDEAGYGAVADPDGHRWFVHCTSVADGTRHLAVGSRVAFRLAAGHLGRREAVEVQAV